MSTTRWRPELMTYCRIMQVGPACPRPCGGCTRNPVEWDHDHWANVDQRGVCHVCLDEPAAGVADTDPTTTQGT